MGRPKQFTERLQVPLSQGVTAQIDSLLDDNEYRLDFIRKAISAEIDRRTHAQPDDQPLAEHKGRS